MEVTIKQAIPAITNWLRVGLVPLIEGSPGIGKSAIAHQIARQFRLKLIDVRLAQEEPVDLKGFPDLQSSPAGRKASYVPMDIFPLEGDPIPDGYDGWLVFFDELTSAPRATQAAAYKVLLDRMIGQRRLHSKVAMMAAGNQITDNAVVEELSTALQSRLVHLTLRPDADGFIAYCEQQNFDSRIPNYIGFKSDAVYTFKPDHTDKTYACPRTWEFVNRQLKGLDISSETALIQLAGTISEGVAREFLEFCRYENELPKMSAILANPEGIAVPVEPAILWTLTGTLAKEATDKNVETIIKFVERMPVEFQVTTMRRLAKRNNNALARHPKVVEWLTKQALDLF